MHNKLKLLLAISALSYCSINFAADDQFLNLRAGEVHEACFDLKTDDKFVYSFKSSSVVRFNIHFHDGKKINYPVSEQMVLRKDGVFLADSTQNYCLMWSNPLRRTLTLQFKTGKEIK